MVALCKPSASLYLERYIFAPCCNPCSGPKRETKLRKSVDMAQDFRGARLDFGVATCFAIWKLIEHIVKKLRVIANYGGETVTTSIILATCFAAWKLLDT